MSADADRLVAGASRQCEALRQMEERSGPIYEIVRERSRIVSAAYKAAGRPRDVTAIDTSDGLARAPHHEWTAAVAGRAGLGRRVARLV